MSRLNRAGLLGVLLLAGCNGDQVLQLGECETEECTPMEAETLVAAGFSGEPFFGEGVNSGAISSQSDWGGFLEAHESLALEDASIDWSSERVVFAYYDESSSCGIRVASHEVVDCGDHYLLHAVFEDTSAACDEQCEINGQGLVLVVMPNDKPTNGCTEVDLICTSD